MKEGKEKLSRDVHYLFEIKVLFKCSSHTNHVNVSWIFVELKLEKNTKGGKND